MKANQLYDWQALIRLQIIHNLLAFLLVAANRLAYWLTGGKEVANKTKSTRILIGCRKQTSFLVGWQLKGYKLLQSSRILIGC